MYMQLYFATTSLWAHSVWECDKEHGLVWGSSGSRQGRELNCASYVMLFHFFPPRGIINNDDYFTTRGGNDEIKLKRGSF